MENKELTPEDRERIEQAVEHYTKDWPRNKLPANKVAFRNGAEYENKYQREQQAELRNKVIEEIIQEMFSITMPDFLEKHIVQKLNSLKK